MGGRLTVPRTVQDRTREQTRCKSEHERLSEEGKPLQVAGSVSPPGLPFCTAFSDMRPVGTLQVGDYMPGWPKRKNLTFVVRFFWR